MDGTFTRFLRLHIAMVAMLACSTLGQEVARQDRNAAETTAKFGNMMADSPVDFSKGVLPKKYPPDVMVQSEPVEEEYRLFSSPCRSLPQIDTIQRDMPHGEFTPPTKNGETCRAHGASFLKAANYTFWPWETAS